MACCSALRSMEPDSILSAVHFSSGKGDQVLVLKRERDAYKEMAENPGLKLRFEDWRREEAYVNKQIQHVEQKLDSIKSKIYLLLAADSLFQGLLLCQVSARGWIPLALSLVASAVATFAVLAELGESRMLQTKLEEQKKYSEALYRATERLRTLGSEYRHNQLQHQPHLTEQDKQARLGSTPWSEAFVVAILITFSSFMALVLRKYIPS